MKTKLHVTWRHRQLQLRIVVYQTKLQRVEWFVLALLPRSRNRLVELDSRCRFVDWLLERWQSVNDCNEQKECDLKGNERSRGFRSKIHQPCHDFP